MASFISPESFFLPLPHHLLPRRLQCHSHSNHQWMPKIVQLSFVPSSLRAFSFWANGIDFIYENNARGGSFGSAKKLPNFFLGITRNSRNNLCGCYRKESYAARVIFYCRICNGMSNGCFTTSWWSVQQNTSWRWHAEPIIQLRMFQRSKYKFIDCGQSFFNTTQI